MDAPIEFISNGSMVNLQKAGFLNDSMRLKAIVYQGYMFSLIDEVLFCELD